MVRIVEEEIIRAFRNNDRSFITRLYTMYLPVVSRYVKKNSGNTDDAKDLIQQVFLIVFQKIRSNEFELSCNFKTYFYAICKNLWLKELRKKKIKKRSDIEPDEIEDVDIDVSIDKEYVFNTEFFLYRLHFRNLDETCKNLIKMKLARLSYDEIASRLNMPNGDIARKKKFRCKELLIKRIKNDPRYKEFIKNEKQTGLFGTNTTLFD